MKKMILVWSLLCFVSVLFVSIASAVMLEDFEYHGYFRVGTGQNDSGGRQQCFQNRDSSARARLGDECNNYGELTFLAHHLKSKEKTGPSFRSIVTMQIQPEGRDTYEAHQKTQNDINFVEMYVLGENLLGPNGQKYWVGKRFYRDVDSHILDFNYYAMVMGNGAGIDNIALPAGKLALAYFQPVKNSSTPQGELTASFLDARVHEIPITSSSQLHLWFGYLYGKGANGQTFDFKDNQPIDPGSATTVSAKVPSNKTFTETKGTVYGARFHTNFNSGFNDIAFVGGRDALSSLGMGDSSSLGTYQSGAKAWRVIDNTTFKLIPSLELHAAAVYQDNDTYTWKTIAARPVYFWDDHVSFAFEGEYSIVDVDGTAATSSKSRKYTKLTIAPQLVPQANIWARPVLRAYYSKFFWNDDNKGVITDSGPYANANGASIFGFQAEVWF